MQSEVAPTHERVAGGAAPTPTTPGAERPNEGAPRRVRALVTASLAEALGLGLFMVSAGLFGTALEAQGSPLRALLGDPTDRRAVMGLIMGLTAVALIRSPWGRLSGAHLNPAVTWTFFRLGRIPAAVALVYPLAQVLGGVAGVALLRLVLGTAFTGPPVDAVATVPGPAGVATAFIAEVLISGLLMSVVLALGRSARGSERTPWIVGLLLFAFITVEAPLSGMSMNPARTLASASVAGHAEVLWLYLVAPLAGMLLAAEAHLRLPRRTRGAARKALAAKHAAPLGCAKLGHRAPCLFCGDGPLVPGRTTTSPSVDPRTSLAQP